MTSFYIVTSYYTKCTKVFSPIALPNFISVLNIAEYQFSGKKSTLPLSIRFPKTLAFKLGIDSEKLIIPDKSMTKYATRLRPSIERCSIFEV
jgi:hypothetical protein